MSPGASPTWWCVSERLCTGLARFAAWAATGPDGTALAGWCKWVLSGESALPKAGPAWKDAAYGAALFVDPEVGKVSQLLDRAGVAESPLGRVPKQNPDRTISAEGRPINDMRRQNDAGSRLMCCKYKPLFSGEKFSNLYDEKISACRICTPRGVGVQNFSRGQSATGIEGEGAGALKKVHVLPSQSEIVVIGRVLNCRPFSREAKSVDRRYQSSPVCASECK